MRVSFALLCVVALCVVLSAGSVEARRVPHKVLVETPLSYDAAPSKPSAAAPSCAFNGLPGLCMSKEQCLSGANQTSTKPTDLCDGQGNFCCVYQEEVQPGCGTAALARAATWANMQLDYCQAPNGGNQSWLPECTVFCNRASNANWDAYRSDCSGLVSYSYGLPAPGRTTREFAPYQTDVTYALSSALDLQPGDPINSTPREHIMLFHSWASADKSSARFYEEPDCGITNPWARLITTNVKILQDGTIALASNGMTFYPIRFYTNQNVC